MEIFFPVETKSIRISRNLVGLLANPTTLFEACDETLNIIDSKEIYDKDIAGEDVYIRLIDRVHYAISKKD